MLEARIALQGRAVCSRLRHFDTLPLPSERCRLSMRPIMEPGSPRGPVSAVAMRAWVRSSAGKCSATASGSAQAGADFVTVSGPLSFDRRIKSRTVTVQVVGDALDETDEVFQVTLSGASGATISAATTTPSARP